MDGMLQNRFPLRVRRFSSTFHDGRDTKPPNPRPPSDVAPAVSRPVRGQITQSTS